MIIIKNIRSEKADSRVRALQNISDSFAYLVKNETDAFTLTNSVLDDSYVRRHGSVEDLSFICAEKALLNACILYLWHMTKRSEQKFSNVIKLIDTGFPYEEDCKRTALDKMFEEVEEYDPSNPAVTEYRLFRKCSGRMMTKVMLAVSESLNDYKGRYDKRPLRDEFKSKKSKEEGADQ